MLGHGLWAAIAFFNPSGERWALPAKWELRRLDGRQDARADPAEWGGLGPDPLPAPTWGIDMKQLVLVVAVAFAAPLEAGTVWVTHANVPASGSTCTFAQAIHAANLANNPSNATPPGASTIAPLARSATAAIGIGTCVGATVGPNTVDLDAIAGQTLTFGSADNFWYGPNALPPVASTIVVEGRGVILQIPADTPRRRFFFIGADAQGVRTPGYNTPGAGVLTLRDVHLRGGRQQGGNSTLGGGGGGFGGAIFNQGIVHLQRTTFSDNRAIGGSIVGGDRTAGGGLGGDAPTSFVGDGGSMGGLVPVGATQAGGSAGILTGGAGGGPNSGFGGFGGDPTASNPATPGRGGNGGGGGGSGLSTDSFSGGGGGGGFGGGSGGGNGNSPFSGGDFGQGGSGEPGTTSGGGGGGVGGGGGSSHVAGSNQAQGGGGGGFGGGGGAGGDQSAGGDGGFGGGGAVGYFQASGTQGRGGFAGGHPGTGLLGPLGGAGAGLGGAIFNHFGVMTLQNVTFTNNQAIAGTGGAGTPSARSLGGAVFNLNGDLSIDQATFADNAAGAGGALYSLGFNGDLTTGSRNAQVSILRSVFANNGPGGEIGNALPSLPRGNPNLASEILTVNGSLVKDPTGAVVPIGSSLDNLLGVDPQLGVLQDNGGLSETRQPELDSVVIDAVDCASPSPGTDQRGIARPQGMRCDMGAVEVSEPSDVLFTNGFET